MNAAPNPYVLFWRRLLPVALLLMLSAPFAGWALRVKPPQNFQDMQAPVPWPDWKSTPVRRWPAAMEDWLNNHFPLRAVLIQAHSLVWHRWIGAPGNDVVVGQDGWLFYSGNRTIEDLRGRDPLDDAQLVRWRRTLEARRNYLRERGIIYLFVVAPNKSSIYPEKLPPLLQRQIKPGKLDQLLAYMAANSDVPILDLRPALLAAKTRHVVYWPTDSHWNGYGLNAATAAILAKLQTLGVKFSTEEDGKWISTEERARNGDCADIIAMRGLWPQPLVPVLRVHPPADVRIASSPLLTQPPWSTAPGWKQPIARERDSGVGRGVLLCDSFFRVGGLAEWGDNTPLTLRFHRFVTFWEWATSDMIAAIAEQEHPDVVIEQWTERFLKTFPDGSPEFPAHPSAPRVTAR
jgi:alginate O-acetyltransferase complex protein AlgJ